ncbi:MAG TPA: VWA domain-containing protein [Blastocatellia bacterium]|nr:VWA domain-containing protein [Blastocatellia bacterium]
MLAKLVALALATAVCATPVLSMQNPAPTPAAQDKDTIRISTSSVQMDVIVTDKTGRRINGLTAADFHILDEGVPQTVDFFSAIEGSRVTSSLDGKQAAGAGGATTRANASPLATPFEGRFVVLVMDDLHLATENLMRSRAALLDFVNNQMRPTDMVAVTATTGAIGALQQFTNDKQRLAAAINRIGALGGFTDRARDSRFNMTAAEAVRIDAGDQGVLNNVKRRLAQDDPAFNLYKPPQRESGSRGGNRPTSRPEEQNPETTPTPENEDDQNNALQSMIKSAAKALVSQMSMAAQASLKTLASLFQGMSDLPGRKVVVLVTEQLVTASSTTGDLSGQLNTLIDIARRSGVSVYAVDASGLKAGNSQASERITGRELQVKATRLEATFSDFENLGAARTLVLGTGGEMILNTNDLSVGLQKAMEDSSSYYVVGFTPSTTPDNKFHRLNVSVKGRSDLIVRTRRGYLAVNTDTVRGTNTELVAALISPVQRIDIPLDVVANVLPGEGGQVTITGFRVGRNYLTLPAATAADQTAGYELVAWIFPAGRDEPAGRIEKTFAYDVKDPEAVKKLKSEGFLYVSRSTQLAPGAYQVRAVIREKTTGHVGSAYQFFEVPDVKNKNDVALSSVLITPTGQTEFSGYNAFKPGSEVDMRWVIYNAPKDIKSLEQRVKMIDAHGKVLMDSPLAPAPGQGADPSQAAQGTRFKLPPMRGRYSLIVSLQGDKGKISEERRADFSIE